ncbi:hypothetical protein DFH08DRAFT_887421, partial [Mycena albidolilacea]
GCLSGSSLVLPPPAPPVDNSPPLEPETQEDSEPPKLLQVFLFPLPFMHSPVPPALLSSLCPHPTLSRPHGCLCPHRHLNLYLVVYAIDMGGSTAKFSERWKLPEQEKLPLALSGTGGIFSLWLHSRLIRSTEKASALQLLVEGVHQRISTVMGLSAAIWIGA